MLRGYYHTGTDIHKTEGIDCFEHIPVKNMFWIDLQFPTTEERREVASIFAIDFDHVQAENELESNDRFYESEDLIFISAKFITLKENHFESATVFLYLINDVLITERCADLSSFDETAKKMQRNRRSFQDGADVLEGILETKFDLDADFIEQIAKDIAAAGRSLSLKKELDMEGMLLKISEYQEAATLSRESFIDKQRIASALLKSSVFKNKERLIILINDINGMIEYVSFIFVRLEYLQNTLLGLINIEQNKTIKIFTILAVVFMPPTLIASIYGMNFKMMPELNWSFGYPLAILLILGSSMFTLYVFKRKKWL